MWTFGVIEGQQPGARRALQGRAPRSACAVVVGDRIFRRRCRAQLAYRFLHSLRSVEMTVRRSVAIGLPLERLTVILSEAKDLCGSLGHTIRRLGQKDRVAK